MMVINLADWSNQVLSITATYFQSFFKSHHFLKPKRVSFYLKHVIAINKDALFSTFFCWWEDFSRVPLKGIFFWLGGSNVKLGGLKIIVSGIHETWHIVDSTSFNHKFQGFFVGHIEITISLGPPILAHLRLDRLIPKRSLLWVGFVWTLTNVTVTKSLTKRL